MFAGQTRRIYKSLLASPSNCMSNPNFVLVTHTVSHHVNTLLDAATTGGSACGEFYSKPIHKISTIKASGIGIVMEKGF